MWTVDTGQEKNALNEKQRMDNQKNDWKLNEFITKYVKSNQICITFFLRFDSVGAEGDEGAESKSSRPPIFTPWATSPFWSPAWCTTSWAGPSSISSELLLALRQGEELIWGAGEFGTGSEKPIFDANVNFFFLD